MIYIVSAVHNRIEITKDFIRQLKKQSFQNYRLILIDDGSTDGTAEMVLQELPNSIVLTGNGDLWWGGALDRAYHYIKDSNLLLKNDVVYICNDDITIDEDFLKTGVRLISINPKVLVSAIGINDETGIQTDGATIRDPVTAEGWFLPSGAEGNCTSTRSLFMTGETYLDIGGMHPILLPHYRSDFEYTIRAARKGHPCVSFDELSYTVHSKTTGEAKAQNIKQRFSKRYMNNPIYNLTFILLVTPVKKIPAYLMNLFRRKRENK